MSYAKRLDALKSKGYEFTVDSKYNFKSEKRFNVTLPDGTEMAELFADITKAVRFCERIEKGQ